MLHEVTIVGMTMDPTSNTPIIILKSVKSDQVVPIWIGLLEATSIASALSDAIAIAIRFSAPIYVDDKIIEQSQMVDTDYEILDDTEEGKKWAEYLGKLSPDDFGKYKV